MTKPRTKDDKDAVWLRSIAGLTCIVLLPGFTAEQMRRKIRRIAKRLEKSHD